MPEQSAPTSPDKKNFLFVIDADSIAHRIMVETGIVSGNKIEIVKGFNVNEKFAIAGQEMLKDSLKVMIMKTQTIKNEAYHRIHKTTCRNNHADDCADGCWYQLDLSGCQPTCCLISPTRW
ncbi:MAG: hypothetical protein U5K79_14875 [Cyclobacteriaceae bacterium]|nr:hypothetical protein [Cyclobacteriaceae bacterium]